MKYKSLLSSFRVVFHSGPQTYMLLYFRSKEDSCSWGHSAYTMRALPYVGLPISGGCEPPHHHGSCVSESPSTARAWHTPFGCKFLSLNSKLFKFIFLLQSSYLDSDDEDDVDRTENTCTDGSSEDEYCVAKIPSYHKGEILPKSPIKRSLSEGDLKRFDDSVSFFVNIFGTKLIFSPIIFESLQSLCTNARRESSILTCFF